MIWISASPPRFNVSVRCMARRTPCDRETVAVAVGDLACGDARCTCMFGVLAVPCSIAFPLHCRGHEPSSWPMRSCDRSSFYVSLETHDIHSFRTSVVVLIRQVGCSVFCNVWHAGLSLSGDAERNSHELGYNCSGRTGSEAPRTVLVRKCTPTDAGPRSTRATTQQGSRADRSWSWS